MSTEKKHIPWNKGLKGVQKHSEATRRKISRTLKRRYRKGELKIWCEGKKNPNHSRWLKDAYRTGRIVHHNLGKKYSDELKKKLSLVHLGQKKGKENNMWRGGKTDTVRKRISTPFWKNLRKLIYERDGWKCTKCDKHGGKLTCHHIIPFRYYYYNGPRNLTTLCLRCHGIVEYNWKNYSSKLRELAEERTTDLIQNQYYDLVNDYLICL